MITEEPDFTDLQKLRIQAERILEEKKDKALLEEEKEADAKKLLHQLQVHQIELEMQNEELRKAYQIAEAALKKYTLLFDQAPVGYLTLEFDGSISELNYTAAEMLGERRFSLINSHFKLYVSEESKSSFDDFFKRVYISGKKESCRLVLGYENESLCHVYLEGIVIENDNKCFLAIINTSQLK